MSDASLDSFAVGFLRERPRASRYDYASRDKGDVAMKLARLLTPAASLLDVGCGTGCLAEILRDETGVSIIGIEPDAERASLASARGLDVHQGFLDAGFLLRHGPFDYIMFADVLEHLPNPAEIVLIAKEGLKPGGSILASVPNVAHWFVRMNLLRGRFDYEDSGLMDATHLRWFTRRTIQEFFVRLGFQITAVDYTVFAGLANYKRSIPWKYMPGRVRRKVVGLLAALWPCLFGCQHVVRATLTK